ncbi:polysaccharide ABC transporter ATP-binding protein [Fusicatenibacter saccharivorans]|uniref:ABC transporter ATP-binding protein n=1 Tax=Fusicatenibacter saccharivorans TaxID=1150298 RepID=UPI003D06A5B0
MMEVQNKGKKIAIQLSGVKKMYKLGQIGGGSLQADIQSWWARIRGKEDPNTKIGQAQRLVGQTFMALNGIDLTVYQGEAVGIIGHNGAGKSTLLKILSRVTAPTEGTIDLYGRVSSMLEVGTGFNGEMTGRENIYMNGAILGMSKTEIDEKIDQIIEFSECGDFIDTPVKRYSSGMFVKLAFSVAAYLEAEIMIMDEVLAVGDMKFQKKCLTRMGDASANENRTVLYVSHNMNTIRQLCTRCIVLNQGKIIYDGDVESAIDVYMEVAADSTQTYFDISNKFQKYLSPVPKAKMLEVRLQGKDSAVYEFNEPIKFRLKINAKEKIEIASLRFEVRAADESSVGTAFALNFGKLEPGDNLIEFEMDTHGLVPGKYHIVLGLFEVNEMGAYNDIDVVEKAMGFEIVDNKDSLGVNWLGGYWGHLKLNDLRVQM